MLSTQQVQPTRAGRSQGQPRTTKNARHPGGDYEYVTPSGCFIHYHDLVQNVGCVTPPHFDV